jgi:hypothetical protein
VIRNGGPPVWLNEYHADFLVHDRLEAARRAAAHRSVLDAIRRSRRPRRRHVAEVLASLGRRLRSLL